MKEGTATLSTSDLSNLGSQPAVLFPFLRSAMSLCNYYKVLEVDSDNGIMGSRWNPITPVSEFHTRAKGCALQHGWVQ